MLDEEGRPDGALARALMILLDGAIVQTLIHRRRAYAEAAARAATTLLCRHDAGIPEACGCARDGVGPVRIEAPAQA